LTPPPADHPETKRAEEMAAALRRLATPSRGKYGVDGSTEATQTLLLAASVGLEPMDEGDEGDDGGGSDVAVDDDGDDDDDGGDEEALLATAQLSPERLTYIESEYGLPGTGSQEERAEAGVEVLRAQSAKLRKKKNGKISNDAKDRRNMQNAWRRVDSYQTEGGK